MNTKNSIVTVLICLLFSTLVQAAPQSLTETTPRAQDDAVPGMSLIPAGEFWMGRTQAFYYDRIQWLFRPYMDDRPAHSVNVDPFYLDKYEVTNLDYQRFAEAAGHAKPWHWGSAGAIPSGQEKWPVYNVTWYDADAYCRWDGKRLPSEAEWEKAARGGLDRKLYPWGDELSGKKKEEKPEATKASRYDKGSDEPKLARFESSGPAPVGLYPATGYGLYDMAGNVWEWVGDWYDRDYYAISPDKNPNGPDTGKYKVLRGGGWSTKEPEALQKFSVLGVYARNYSDPSLTSNTYGFRCAKSAQEPPKAP